jgi:hypothetical protein
VQDEALERLAALGRDKEATGATTGDERLLHRVAARDELLVVRHHDGRAPGPRRRPGGRIGTYPPAGPE